MPPFIPLIGLGLSEVLLYLGFAPHAPRWRLSLGILGIGISIVIWRQIGVALKPLDIDDIDLSLKAFCVFASLAFIGGAALIATLQGWRCAAAIGLGVMLPVWIGLIVFGSGVAQQSLEEYQRSAAVQSDLDEHQAMWQANRPRRYRYILHQSVFCAPGHCPPDTTISVAPGRPSIWSVEELFRKIQTAIDRGYDTITVTYQPELGYPLEIYTDPEILATDDQEHLTIREFQILP